jgi:hypothetical protein
MIIRVIVLFYFFIRKVYDQLIQNKTIVPKEEPLPPTVPMDYDWARVSFYFFLFFKKFLTLQ